MNPIDDDTLQAYVDGELDASDAARIDAALAHDDVLARRVEQARAVRAQLRAAFDPVLDEPVPARLSALLQPRIRADSDTGHAARAACGWAWHGTTRRRATRRWFVPGAALAASVALLAVALWWWQPGGDLVRMQGGQSFAAGALTHALDEALASEPKANAPVAIGLSFRSTDGRICRTFVLHTPPARAGLACHERYGLGAARAQRGGSAGRRRTAPGGERLAARGASRGRRAFARQCLRCTAGARGARRRLALGARRVVTRRPSAVTDNES